VSHTGDCGKDCAKDREVLLSADSLAVYVEVAKAHYQQEEDRWRTAEDKAKTIFAIAALVATLMFARLDWTLASVPQGWQHSIWLVTVVVGAAMLLAALVLAAKVLAPKAGWGLEPPHIALGKLAGIPPQQAQQYLGESYARTACKNAKENDSQLRWIRLATRLIIVSVAIALAQIIFILAAGPRSNERQTNNAPGRTRQEAPAISRGPTH